MMGETQFQRCLAIAWLPQNDGQEYHVTIGDKGGGTRFGVIFSLFKSWRLAHKKPEPTDVDFEKAPISELQDIIRSWIWLPCDCDNMPVGIDLMLFEACFMSGPHEAITCLQHCLGVTQDSIIGPETLLSVHERCETVKGACELVHDMADYYEDWLGELHNATLFLKGWDRRVNADVDTATAWIRAQANARTV